MGFGRLRDQEGTRKAAGFRAPARRWRSIVPTSTEMRAAVYVILAAARDHEDRLVRRVLAGQAFVLAQQAQMRSWTEADQRFRIRQAE